MSEIFSYYSLNLFFYLIEIYLFKSIYMHWPYDVFFLNAGIRGILSIFFSILVRKIIFKESKNFYIKIFLIVLLNPIASSTMLKIFIELFSGIEVWVLKIMGDIIISLIAFIILKK